MCKPLNFDKAHYISSYVRYFEMIYVFKIVRRRDNNDKIVEINFIKKLNMKFVTVRFSFYAMKRTNVF